MRTKLLGWIVAACAAGPAGAASPADEQWFVDYQLTFEETEGGLPQASILAVLTWNRDLGSPPEEVELQMRWDYPGGYASYVRDFEAYVPAGSKRSKGSFEVRVDTEAGKFTVPVLEDGSTGIRYRIPLEYDPPEGLGFDETPHAFEDGVFWNGRALFVHHRASRNTLTVSVPEGQHATTSFAPGKRDGSYDVGDSGRLCNSFWFVGNHLERSFEIEGSEVVLALGRPLAPKADLMEDTLSRFFGQAAEVFGGPSPARSVVALNLTAPEGTYDGAVYGDDAHIAFHGELDEDNAETWRPILCHESFHLWNPTMVPLEDRQMWFSEGFTDYYAHLLLVRAGLYSGDTFLEDVRGWCRDYLLEAGETGLWEAGVLGAKNRTLLYQGGALAALCLDIEIRHGSSNRASLDDVMSALYEGSGSGQRRSQTLQDLERILEDVGGRSVDGFIERHVEGSETLPLAQALSRAGLDFAAEQRRVPVRDSLWRLIRCSGMVARGDGILIQRSEGELRVDDVLIEVTGQAVGDYGDLSMALAGLVPGDRVELVVERGGERRELALDLGGDPAEIEWEDRFLVEIRPAPKAPVKARRIREALFAPRN